MGSVIDTATAILSRSERLVELAGENISNIGTPGYKRHISFERVLLGAQADRAGESQEYISSDFTPGKLTSTNSPFDLAIAGEGFFTVSSGETAVYTRQGQFQRTAEGRLVNAQGQALQVDGGGDLILKSDAVKILEDGTVLENSAPVAKLAVAAIDNPKSAEYLPGGGYRAAGDHVRRIDQPSVRQGMLEASNVSMGAEMITIMGALRHAETGQRLVGVYDDLLGRVISTIGQS